MAIFRDMWSGSDENEDTTDPSSRGMWSSSSEEDGDITELDRQQLSNLTSSFRRDSKGDVTHVTIGGQLLCMVCAQCVVAIQRTNIFAWCRY